jgi:hypothetical protein
MLRNRIIIVISLVLCLGVWVRTVGALLVNPSPWRTIQVIKPDTAPSQYRFFCQRQSFADGDLIWQWPCFERDDERPTTHLLRFNMAQGTADARWPLPFDDHLALIALAKHNNGDLAVIFGGGSDRIPTRYYRVKAAGGVEDWGSPHAPDEPDTYGAGLAWVGDDLQTVVGRGQRAVIYTYHANGWAAPRAFERLTCDVTQVCELEVAYRQAGAWRLLYSRFPRRPANPDETTVDLLIGSEAGTPTPAGTLTLRRERHYSLNADGELVRHAGLFDTSPGGVITDYIGITTGITNGNTVPFVLQGKQWVELPIPDVSGLQPPNRTDPFQFQAAFDDYLIQPNRLDWLPYYAPDFGFAHVHYLKGKWIAFEDRTSQIRAREVGGSPGPALIGIQRDRWDMVGDTLTPSSDGGYWYKNSLLDYVKLNDRFERADGFSVIERLLRVPQTLNANGRGYRENAELKSLLFWGVLLGMPLILVAILLWRQFRRSMATWESILLPFAIAYIALFILAFTALLQATEVL